jgi:RimJ/RimL family protein N-acetyltransferase
MASQLPTIGTEQLILRPFTLADVPEVQKLAGDWEVASRTMEIIPHPYEDGMAEEWIITHQNNFANGIDITLAITHREGKYLIGAIALTRNQQFENAFIGYWLGKIYWNKGYCTEASKAMLKYGFEVLSLNRIFASHLSRNPASGRVMLKTGMRYEGHWKQHAKVWGEFEDLEWYGILRSEYLEATRLSLG